MGLLGAETVKWVRLLMENIRKEELNPGFMGVGGSTWVNKTWRKFFRVGGREGGERMACENTHSTRERLGRCPKCGFSSGVSLLRPTHGTYCLFCCVEPHCTHPQSTTALFIPLWEQHTRLSSPSLYVLQVQRWDPWTRPWTVWHSGTSESFPCTEVQQQRTGYVSLPTCD